MSTTVTASRRVWTDSPAMESRRFCDSVRSVLRGDVDESPPPIDNSDLVRIPPATLLLLRKMRRKMRQRKQWTTADLAVGQVWSTDPGDYKGIGTLVLVTYVNGAHCRVVVCTLETWIADDRTLILSANENPFKKELAVCFWRDVPMASKHLRSYGGKLRKPVMNRILRHLQWRLTGGKSVSLTCGSPITGKHDFRREAQQLYTEATQYLETSALEGL